MSVFRIAYANLKKKKSMSSTLILLSFFAILLLNIGLILYSGLKNAYPEKAEELNSPDFIVIAENDKYHTSFETFLKNDSRVEYVEKEDVIFMGMTENSANSLKFGALIFSKDKERSFSPFRVLKEAPSVPPEKAIYLPLSLESKTCTLGSNYLITCKNVEYDFQIAGFFETTYLGTTTSGLTKYFVPEERFQKLQAETTCGRALSAGLKEADISAAELSDSLKKDFLESTDYYIKTNNILSTSTCVSYLDMQYNISAMLSVPMILLLSFSLIISSIVIIIVHFKVVDEIEENLPAIGSLQALGYTSGQIITSIAAEFLLTGLLGGIAAAITGRFVIPYITSYNAVISGIIWIPDSQWPATLLSVFLILFLMAASALFAARRIKKLSPVTAFRKGVTAHYFGKNFFPLEKGRSSVFFRLALKNICSDLKQNLTTGIIIALGVFALSISTILYANFAYDSTAMAKSTSMEVSDIQLTLLPHTDIPSFLDELNQFSEIEKTNLQETCFLEVDGEVKILTGALCNCLLIIYNQTTILHLYSHPPALTGIQILFRVSLFQHYIYHLHIFSIYSIYVRHCKAVF